VMTNEGKNRERLTWNTRSSSAPYKEEGAESTATFLSLAPAWSPDGKWIAFFCYNNSNAEICVMRPDGSDKTRLTFDDAHDGAPSWRIKPQGKEQ
jgi:Tol biopolymer transport system component